MPHGAVDATRRPRRLLIAAAIFHIVVTISIYGVARYQVAPSTIDINGIAFRYVSDGIEIREKAAILSDNLTRGQIRDWLMAPSPFHIKLYSICFALLGPWFGATILSAEPLNALCYLAILVLTFNLGKETLDRRAGLIAAVMVGLWPSFLLHTTQLLRDPLFLAGMLAFILVNLHFLSRSFSWVRALVTGAGGGVIAVFIWLVRDNMGALMIATVALGGAMLIVRQFREKHFQAANLVGMALLIVISVGVTRVVPKSSKIGVFEWPETSSPNPLSRIAAQVGNVRQRFVNAYPESGSNIDSDVQLRSPGDIVRYLPRAAAIGFFAPFPNMWLVAGRQVGSGARLLSGLETIAMLVVEGLALIGLWRGRRRFLVWWLGLVAAMGIVSLGLVVVNVGALYRLRYVFLILVIILAAGGAAQTLAWCKKKRLDGSGPAADV